MLNKLDLAIYLYNINMFQFFNCLNRIYIYMVLVLPITLFVLYCNHAFLNYKGIYSVYCITYTLVFVPNIAILVFVNKFLPLNEVLIFNQFKTTLLNTSSTFFIFYIDKISVIFSSTTLVIGFFANKFQWDYMRFEKKKERFFYLINLFLFSMVFLVLSYNLIFLLFCWEMLGITSFFLISFYDLRPYTLKSAIKAFSFNRLSDMCIFLYFIFYYVNCNSVYMYENSLYNSHTLHMLTYFFLTIAALIKSAQFIFFSWLPDSMEAPAPASALIHSATLVSAGIYLCIRNFNEISLHNNLILFLRISSILSMLLFSFIAIFQTDIKKLLAYSTISNCALIYFFISTYNIYLSLIYFVIHGLFKSLSFIIAGQYILSNAHKQDFRQWVFNKNTHTILNTLFISSILGLSSLYFSIPFEIKHTLCAKAISYKLEYYFYKFSMYLYYIFTITYGQKAILTNNFFNKNYKHNSPIVNATDYYNLPTFIHLYFLITIGISIKYYYLSTYDVQHYYFSEQVLYKNPVFFNQFVTNMLFLKNNCIDFIFKYITVIYILVLQRYFYKNKTYSILFTLLNVILYFENAFSMV